MNERERVLAVFQRRVPFPNLTLGSPSSDGKGEVPDQTPWYADLSYWYSGQKAMGRLPGKYEGDEGYLRLHQDAGAGIYLYAPGVWKEEFDESIQTEQKKEENRIISTIFTPLGKLTAIQEYLSQSFTSAYREHYIKKKEDLKIMRYLFTHRRITSCFDDFLRIDSLWNGWGLPVVLAPCCVSPLQTLLTRWAGVETTVNLLVEGREELEEAIIELQEADNEIFKIISQAPGQMVVFGENLSGEITGQKLMAQYEIPYWQKRIEQLHQVGKWVLLHNDGTLKASLPLLAETALDAVEAVTPAPVGDLTVQEVKEICQGKSIVWGCLPGALFSPLYPEDYFKDYLKKVLETFPAGSGFVLGVADQVPPDADFARICLVRKVLEEKV